MEDAVRTVVRPTERVRVILEARDPAADDHRASRALAVISRMVESGSIPAELEQGCLLVLKGVPRSGSLAFILHDAIPIDESFEISMAQTPSSTLDLRPGVTGASRTDLTITVKSSHPSRASAATGPSSSSPVLTFTTTELETLRTLLEQCKRLKDAASSYPAAGFSAASFGSTPLGDGQTWPWLAPYLHFHHPSSAADIPISYCIPSDLRLLHPSPNSSSPLSTQFATPASAVYTRLSPAHAGAPFDANGDIDIIREAWMQSQLVSVVQSAQAKEEKSSLSIHVGTFNVNGKLPVEGVNLDSWLGIAHEGEKGNSAVIPPVPAVSPFEVPLPSDGDEPESVLQMKKDHQPPNVGGGPANKPADVITLSFQELDLSTAALIYSTEKSREEAWAQAVLRSLNKSSTKGEPNYVKLASKQLVGMLLLVFVRSPLAPCFTSIHTSNVGAGLMGMMGNKGGVALRLGYVPAEATTVPKPIGPVISIGSPTQDPTDVPLPPSTTTSTFPSSASFASTTTLASTTPAPSDPKSSARRPTILTFVNAHLAAFDEMYDRRNADFLDLCRRLSFDVSIRVPDFKAGTEATWPPVDPTTTLTTSIFESDALFWMGDLNYRIDLPDVQIRSLLQVVHQPGQNTSLAAESMALLQKHDQLKKAQREAKAFVGFSEAEIEHIPTYRFNPGLAVDSLGYDVKRKPAWTDRVLHMGSLSSGVRQSLYKSHPEITQSDHRPVSASFEVDVVRVDTDAYDKAVKDLWRKVAGIEDAEDLPQLEISHAVIELGKILYEKQATETFTIKNTGRVPCVWRLVPLEQNASPTPEWMSVDVPCGLVLPQQEITLTIRILVSQKIAADLNIGPRRLEHTLILRTALGKDHFLAVGGEYQPTVFGNSLETLSRLTGSIRLTKGVSELKDADKARGNAKEVMRLIGWLMDKGSAESGLFLTPGDDALVSQIREALDTDTDLPTGPDNRVASLAVASSLLEFLQSLSPPLVPSSLLPELVGSVDRDDAYRQLSIFPPASVNIWVSLNAFMHFYIRHQTATKDDPEAAASALADDLTALLAPILMADEEGITNPVSPADKHRFMKFFITD